MHAGTGDGGFGTGFPEVCCVTMHTAVIGLTLGTTPGDGAGQCSVLVLLAMPNTSEQSPGTRRCRVCALSSTA